MSILKRPGWANYEIVNEGRLHNDKLKDRIGKMFDRLSLGYSPNHVVDKIANIIKIEKGDKFDYNKLTNEDIISIANSDFITRGKFTPTLRPSFAKEYQNTNNDVSDAFTTDVPTTSNEPVSLSFSAPTEISTPSIPTNVTTSEDSEEDEESYDEDEESYDEDDQAEMQSSTNTKDYHKSFMKDFLSGLDETQLMQYKKLHSTDDSNKKQLIDNEIQNRSSAPSEDAEKVDTCNCEKQDQVFSKEIPKENMKRIEQPRSSQIPTLKNYHKEHKPISKEAVKLSPTAVNKLLQENYLKQKQHKARIEEKYRR